MKKNTSGLCIKCGQPLVGRALCLNAGKPAGRCRDCINKAGRKSYHKNHKKNIERGRAYRKANLEVDRERHRQRAEQYRLANPEKVKEQRKVHYLKNKDKILQQRRDDIKCKEYRIKNKDDIQQRVRQWQNKNPDKVITYRNKRRAMKNKATGHVSERDWAFIKALYGHRCLWCLRQEPEVKLTMDHVVPLSKGGTHTPQNIQPLCKSCNSKKHTKTIDFRYPHLVVSWLVCCSPSVLQEYVLEPNV